MESEEYKMAEIWIRAPWRDLENYPLPAMSDKWVDYYVRFSKYFEKIFTLKDESYALDAFTNRNNKSFTIDNFVSLGSNDLRNKFFAGNKHRVDWTKISEKIQNIKKYTDSFNRAELALLIANCIISRFTYCYNAEIEDLCIDLLQKYYHSKKTPYIKTLGYKVFSVNDDSLFFGELSRKWKNNSPNNLDKYPYNDLLPSPVK